MNKIHLFLLLVALFFTLNACAHKSRPSESAMQSAKLIEDVRVFPQNLEFYSSQAHPDKPLLEPGQQEICYENFKDIFFGPWHMTRCSIKRSEVINSFGRARGYKKNNAPWLQAEWDAMRHNANLGQFPSRTTSAIILRNTSLRELPTNEERHLKPVADPALDPFDYFQYSLLPIGTPVLVCHTSLDGKWHYIECPLAGGWVNSQDVAFADENFKKQWQNGAYAALISENIVLPGTGRNGNDSKASIGTILPFQKSAAMNIAAMLPVAGKNGYATTAEIALPLSSAIKMPMALTASNIAALGNKMMGQPYGWGGMNGDRDCSAMIRDLFAPFGIWLPRNSSAQARRGHVISLTGLEPEEKAQLILKNGVPFLSLLGMRGHIGLYVGKYQQKPAIFHNVWGVRIVENGNDDERFVIGKAVVTSITPGMELKNLYRPVTFADRLRTLTTIGIR